VDQALLRAQYRVCIGCKLPLLPTERGRCTRCWMVALRLSRCQYLNAAQAAEQTGHYHAAAALCLAANRAPLERLGRDSHEGVRARPTFTGPPTLTPLSSSEFDNPRNSRRVG
jgi:uncharacterized paraquat-inducible protein A